MMNRSISNITTPRRNISTPTDGWTVGVGVCLNVRVQVWSVIALKNRLDCERWVMVEDVRKSITNGQVDGLDVDIVLESDDAVVGEIGRRVEDLFKGGLVRS